jgi:hypothetical protein
VTRRRSTSSWPVQDGSKLDDELVDLTRLYALRVSPTVTRSFEVGFAGPDVLVFGPHVDGDGEMVRDFWGVERPLIGTTESANASADVRDGAEDPLL